MEVLAAVPAGGEEDDDTPRVIPGSRAKIWATRESSTEAGVEKHIKFDGG
jgi:hypothetical protein